MVNGGQTLSNVQKPSHAWSNLVNGIRGKKAGRRDSGFGGIPTTVIFSSLHHAVTSHLPPLHSVADDLQHSIKGSSCLGSFRRRKGLHRAWHQQQRLLEHLGNQASRPANPGVSRGWICGSRFGLMRMVLRVRPWMHPSNAEGTGARPSWHICRFTSPDWTDL